MTAQFHVLLPLDLILQSHHTTYSSSHTLYYYMFPCIISAWDALHNALSTTWKADHVSEN